MAPIISIIIPTYNRNTLLRAIGSCLQQSIGLDNLEVIVVDDCSTDDTRQLLESLLLGFRSHLKVINNKQNSGPGLSRNRGIEAAVGEYLFFLDSDDILLPNALKKMCDVARQSSSEIVVAKKSRLTGEVHAPGATRESVIASNVYDSRVFYTIGPAAKLFEARMIRDRAIAFQEDRRWGEDQSFVIGAYFAASRISVLADEDYVLIGGDDLSLTRQSGVVGDKLVTALSSCDLIQAKAIRNKSEFLSIIFVNCVVPSIVELVNTGQLFSDHDNSKLLKEILKTHLNDDVLALVGAKGAELLRGASSALLRPAVVA